MARLTEAEVAGFLAERGVLAEGEPAAVRPLSGGVSGSTYLVETGRARYVVKQPLPFLDVADEWPARVERAGVEASALWLCGELTPDRLPELIDHDAERHVLTMTAAPAAWTEWRQELLGGEVDAEVGTTLGTALGTWHRRTAERVPELTGLGLADLEGFLELRGDPYHRTVAARRPELATDVTACLNDLLESGRCLVHGDFSPKNVLVGPRDAADRGVWALDFEVAHLGNPVFDVAFCLHHLVMKAVHRPVSAPSLLACARAFRGAYAAAGGLAVDEPETVRHTGALLLARVFGKSPAGYLTAAEAERVAGLGAAAVRRELAALTGLFTPSSPR